jgi:hypothetical protein
MAADTIEDQFDEQKVGGVTAVHVILEGFGYKIWAMKEAGLVTKIIWTAPGLLHVNNVCMRMFNHGNKVQFKYTEPQDLYFKYWHYIDDYSKECHDVPSIESSLDTQC